MSFASDLPVRLRQDGAARPVQAGALLHTTGTAARMVLTRMSLAVASGVLIEAAANRREAGPIGGAATIALDASRTRTVTGTSHVARITDLDLRGGTVRDIRGNGHDARYDAATVPALQGRTYRLAGGGRRTAV